MTTSNNPVPQVLLDELASLGYPVGEGNVLEVIARVTEDGLLDTPAAAHLVQLLDLAEGWDG